MKRNRKNKTMLLAVLVVAVLSMSVVFAAMSTTLKIKGSGLLSADAWNIKFENLASVTLKGTAEETTAPTIKADTEIGDYRVVFKRTEDEVVYNFDVHNYGSMNAKIEELNIPLPVCTGNATDEEQKIADALLVSESLTYTLTYSDGEEVKVGDTLKAEEIKSLTLRLAYTGENMPSESVEITGLNISIKYVQDMSTEVEEPEIPVESVDPETLAGKRFDKETKVMIDDTIVTIPGGATISALPGEYESVDDGLVMYVIPEGEEVADWNADTDNNKIIDVQEKYDQFVWIPVKKAVLDLSDNPDALASKDNINAAVQSEIDEGRYPIAIKKDKFNYQGLNYRVMLVDEKTKVKSLIDYTEPSYLTDTSSGDASSKNDVGITEELLQEEFNTMVEKVNKNKGFWIGRYEVSNLTYDSSLDSTQQAKIVKGVQNSNRSWYRCYAQQKNYSNIVKISSISSMVYNCQWDQVMIWMKDVRNVSQNSYYVVNSIGMGVHGGDDPKSSTLTGKYEEHKVKNIYNMAGGSGREWTQGGNGKNRRTGRGDCSNGNYAYNGSIVSAQDNGVEAPAYSNTSRVVLF